MSRIAKNPIKITNEVECSFNQGIFSAKGKLGKLDIAINSNYNVKINDDNINLKKNRLILLTKLKNKVNQISDFSVLIKGQES